MNTNFDNDLDAFLNYDQNEQTPMSSSAADVKPVPALLADHSDLASNSSTFSRPSYQYDSHRQQTGLPMGAYQSTLAINQATGLHYRPGNHGFVMPTQTLNMPLSDLSEFDFARPAQYDQNEMDFDTESPADIPSMFYPGEGQSSVSPANALPPRIYPGMHTQQANQAKIQAAQKQQEMIKQQQQRQLPAGQRPLPASAPKAPVPSSAPKDPHVEESISRLLSRMRQNSTASAADDDDTSPTGAMSGMPRLKKDEDDMDEDERLLNSEEGKKLSSKERRQLRNKVSARAFRSRRKEYITQLESEVAAKAQEANELRVHNRQLMEENTRLTDLTRMLLSSQAFAGFLQELSNSGVPNTAQPLQQQQQASQQSQPQPQLQSQPQPQPQRKDIPPHEAARHMQNLNQHTQVGMTLVPETPIDISAMDGYSSWNNIVPSNDFQVFAATEMPEPPKLDLTRLNEKSTSTVRPVRSSKKQVPVIPSLPPSPASAPVGNPDDLYADESLGATVSLALPKPLHMTLCKASVKSLATAAASSTCTGSWSELHQLCDELDETWDKIASLIG